MAAARTLAVASGKGGVGKSVVALNLSVALALHGQRVLLVDTDLGLGNIAVLLGISPEYALEDLLMGRCGVGAAALEGPQGIWLLPAASDGDVDFWEREGIDENIEESLRDFEESFDYIVVDTGAGIAARSVDFVTAAGEVLLLTTAEPTAIADAYATLKVLLQRRPDLALGLLVNMADSRAEADDLHEKFKEIVLRFLGAEIDNRGYIPLDRYVREAVKRQVPFVLAAPLPPAAEALVEIARLLLDREVAVEFSQSGFFARALQQRKVSTRPD